MMHEISLVLGDWSHDGHGMTETRSIKSNLTSKELLEAYKIGCKVIGFEIDGNIAAEYEDTAIVKADLDRLRALGFEALLEYEDEGTDEDDDSVGLSRDDYARIWLHAAKLGEPKFEWEFVESNSIEIGGYGLFVS